jgi:hypothetical protein
MQVGHVLNATRVVGKAQGYSGLPVRDESINLTINGPSLGADVGSNVMVTAWHPTPKEVAAINLGAPVHVRILGVMHPPIQVSVGDIPGLS